MFLQNHNQNSGTKSNAITAEDVRNFRVIDLRNFCRENGIKGYSKLKKQDLQTLVLHWLEKNAAEKVSQISAMPTPLTSDFLQKRVFVSFDAEKALEEEKRVLEGWYGVKKTLQENILKMPLLPEITAVSKQIVICKHRIKELKRKIANSEPLKPLNLPVASAVKYITEFQTKVLGKKTA